jgi:hypothetical protein
MSENVIAVILSVCWKNGDTEELYLEKTEDGLIELENFLPDYFGSVISDRFGCSYDLSHARSLKINGTQKITVPT